MALGMECIFILSELKSPEATEGLVALASDKTMATEARSAAVWGLGITGVDEALRVLPFVADADDDVALHALACIGELDARGLSIVQRVLETGSDREAASAVELLAQAGPEGIEHLLEVAQRQDRPAIWALAALGEIPEAELRETVGASLPSSLVSALSPMWLMQGSWLNEKAQDPLEFLRRQLIRHLD